jgi:hypothetical protein
VNPGLQRLFLVRNPLASDEDLIRGNFRKPVVLRRKAESNSLAEDFESALGANGNLTPALGTLQRAHAAGDPKMEQQNGNLPGEGGG